MKNLLKISLSILIAGTLTSCVVYPDGYSGNEQYYDSSYQNGYYYAPQAYYGNGGYYGNDGYYYRDNFNYQYDGGIPYYYGVNFVIHP